MLPLIILIVIVVLIVVFVISLYNGLIQKRNRVDEAFSQIDVQLKRRLDLIPRPRPVREAYQLSLLSLRTCVHSEY